ncbi:MAG: PEGA domain-containing protein [Myxococcota bacterium]|nr:PEGA domain-containing protein [Deltaproteobacteria bacterium]MDQ3335113.1 PEGA domain-containing protein [Myxococcota bacterium]
MKALLVLLLLCQTASADSPWTVGVTESQKSQAKTALDAGNALFLEKKYSEALAQYQTAIGAWDHPAIRFNVVRCLIQLDRPVEAFDNLKIALKYGAAPFEEGLHTEALAYEKLLAKQIGEVAIDCAQSGVRLTLDGQSLGTCPVHETKRVAPGPHQVVGVKDGFLTKTFEIVVVGGARETVSVALEPLTANARIEHRWSTWIPWVVFGSGFAVIGAGALLDLSAAADMDSYDRIVKQQCSMMACNDADLPTHLKDDAEMKSNIAVGVMVVGAATVAAGGVMLYLNRGRPVYGENLSPRVVPTTGGAALMLNGRF